MFSFRICFIFCGCSSLHFMCTASHSITHTNSKPVGGCLDGAFRYCPSDVKLSSGTFDLFLGGFGRIVLKPTQCLTTATNYEYK